MRTDTFEYDQAFARNIGILSPDEQAHLRSACVGVAGLGGAGSNYVLALARLGVGRIVIASPDHYELANMNRQAGATMTTLGTPKAQVMADMISDINPTADVRLIPEAISEQTIGRFLDGTDVVIDAIDGRDIEAHVLLHERASARGLFSVLGGVPAGFGASLTVFGPGSASFYECFGIAPQDDRMTILRKSFSGLFTLPMAATYLPDIPVLTAEQEAEINFSSVSPTLYLCTALATTEVLMILLKRRPPTLAPEILQVDLCLRALSIAPSSSRTRELSGSTGADVGPA